MQAKRPTLERWRGIAERPYCSNSGNETRFYSGLSVDVTRLISPVISRTVLNCLLYHGRRTTVGHSGRPSSGLHSSAPRSEKKQAFDSHAPESRPRYGWRRRSGVLQGLLCGISSQSRRPLLSLGPTFRARGWAFLRIPRHLSCLHHGWLLAARPITLASSLGLGHCPNFRRHLGTPILVC